MKVALAHSYLGGAAGGGGGVRQMLQLALGLDAQGHEVTICAQNYEPGTIDPQIEERFEIRSPNVGPIKVPSGHLAFQRSAIFGSGALARVVPRDVDVLNVHEYPAQLAALYLKPFRDYPIVWTRNDTALFEMAKLQDESTNFARSYGRAVNALRMLVGLPDLAAARAMDAIVVLDKRNRDNVERAYKRTPRIIQSGAAAQFFDAPTRAEARAQLGIPEDEFAVLAVGILVHYRRHEDIVSAVAQLGPEGRTPRLRVIGSNHLFPEVGVALERQIADAKLEERVELIQTAVGERDLVAHFAAADAFVFANEMQTWGLAPLEAIAAGTPVIVSRGAGVHEVLEGRPGVQLVDPRSPDQIAAALESIRRDPAAWDIGETREWTRDEFSTPTFARKMAALFDELR
jgi:glycosyltransferase involved in cell wall biosynthesis